MQKDEGVPIIPNRHYQEKLRKGEMLKRFKGGAENRNGGRQKVEEEGEQEILGGIIALRRIVRGEHQKARSLNLSKQ